MGDKINIVTLNSFECNVTEIITTNLSSNEIKNIDAEVSIGTGLNSSLEDLSQGRFDILALPAAYLHGNEADMIRFECEVNGAITPKRPNFLLISENKIDYQPKSAIILCDYKIIRRQLRRSRKDLRVLSSEAFLSISKLNLEHENQIEKVKWMEESKKDGIIDGYVTSRKIYDALSLNGRRHTLLPDPKDRGGSHFLPMPYSDLIILIVRKSSPKSLTNSISEKEGATIWWIQNKIIGKIESSELQNLGILVRHRRVRSLMEEAEKNKDLTLEQACHDSEGEVLDSEVHVEIKIEKISKNGKRTVSIQRLIPISKFEYATISLIKDWNIMLKEASQEIKHDFNVDIIGEPFIDLNE